MGSGRAYTKSGSIQKYESSRWSTPLWSSSSAKGTVSTPDSNGNYTVTAPTGYKENSNGGVVTCTTHYGGVAKVFYFEIAQYTNVTINFTATVNKNVRGECYIRVHTNYNRLPCDVFVNITCQNNTLNTFSSTLIFNFDDLEYTQTVELGLMDDPNFASTKIINVTFHPDTYKDDKNGINYTFTCQY